MIHQPVLLSELIQYLNPQSGQNFIDATIGAAGHSKSILSKTAPRGRVLGIDYDQKVIDYLKQTIKSRRLKVVHGNFKNLKKIAGETGFKRVSGIYFDLGLGSWQIEDSTYGLSFQKEMPLDMRIEKDENRVSAAEIVNKWPEDKLIKIFQEYGEIRGVYQIVKRIKKYRDKKPIQSTQQLKEAVGIKDPGILAKIFQALRITVNNELVNLKTALPQAIEILKKGGKIGIISYHSGEDRIVKNFFREKQKEGVLKIITKKPITPTSEEIKRNPKSRSAKLRVAVKL